MQVAQIQATVLLLSANALVRDNVRVLLRTMGYQCVLASTLSEAFLLLEQQLIHAAILDPQQAGTSPAEVVAGFQTMQPSPRGRIIVLTNERGDPELSRVIEAYSLPRVPAELVFQELYPMLDSMLRRNIEFRRVVRRARRVFDSRHEPAPAGIRSFQVPVHRLLYEADNLMVDLSLEPEKDSQRIALVGQVVDPVHVDHPLNTIPVVLQSRAGLIGIAATNEFGEFSFQFDSRPSVTLEIGVKEDEPLVIELADLQDAVHGTTEEPESAETSSLRKTSFPRKPKGGKQ